MAKKDEKKKEVSYVMLENANMTKLTLRQISKLYTRYANLTLELNDLRKLKTERKKELVKKMGDLEADYITLIEALPKKKFKDTDIPTVRKPAKARDVEVIGTLESFEGLRREFEKIREQLEKI